MREKILKIMQVGLHEDRTNLQVADAILAAIGEGQAVWHLDAETAKFLADMIMADAPDEPSAVTLRVGFIKDDDGKIQHGLLVEDSEYPEEGASLLVETPAPQPAPDVAQLPGMRNQQHYCNKCGYFGAGVQHAKPGTESLCDYNACETKESAEFRQLEAELAATHRKLAAAQALVCMYRDALVDGPENLSNSLAEELATHADNSALDTLLAAKERETIERCKKVCDKRAERWALHGKEAAAEAHEAKMCAAAIGAMLQKEPS